MGRVLRVGLISDTHGLLRPEALAALRGAEHLIHGGDIGPPEILDALRALAPLTVVRGNNDRAPWADVLPEEATVTLGGVRILVIHDVKTLAKRLDADVVVSGHSHRPGVESVDGLLRVNPGSAGPRRFSLPITVGELLIEDGRVSARIVPIASVAPVRARAPRAASPSSGARRPRAR